MIISKLNKFIFVRVLKTGSTSAQAMLVNSGILGEQDIFTGFRNNVTDVPSPNQNVCSDINANAIRLITPYKIPNEIHVAGDGTFPLVGHLTPTEMVRLKMITEQELINQFKVIGVVRDPIDRYLSAWFFVCNLINYDTSYEKLIEKLDYKIEMPNAFLGKTQRNFFEYEGELLDNIQVINYNNLNEELQTIVHNYGGNIDKYKTLKSQYRPSWAKEPYHTWLPKHHIESLSNYMAQDVEFFEQHT